MKLKIGSEVKLNNGEIGKIESLSYNEMYPVLWTYQGNFYLIKGLNYIYSYNPEYDEIGELQTNLEIKEIIKN